MRHHLLTFSRSLVALLLLAVCSVSHAQDDDPIVATVNGYPIKWADIDSLVSQMPLGEQVVIRSDPEKFAESLVQEEVLFQYGLGTNFTDDPELREQIKTLVVNHLIEKYVTSQLVVSEDAIKEFYDSNTSAIRGETIQVSHILTESRDECEGLLEQLDGGKLFADLAIEHSIHEASAVNGGQLGSLMNHDGPLGFEQQLFELPQDQPTLYESEDGCHIVVVTGRETPPLPPLENVSAAIENLLIRELEIETLQALMERAHDQVDVVLPE